MGRIGAPRICVCKDLPGSVSTGLSWDLGLPGAARASPRKVVWGAGPGSLLAVGHLWELRWAKVETHLCHVR